jgi:hypothetical protein
MTVFGVRLRNVLFGIGHSLERSLTRQSSRKRFQLRNLTLKKQTAKGIRLPRTGEKIHRP